MRAVLRRCCVGLILFSVGRAKAWSDEPQCVGHARDLQATCGTLAPSATTAANDPCALDVLAAGSATPQPPKLPEVIERARNNVKAADALYKAGKLEDAMLHLRSVEQEPLRVLDRIALRRADMLRELGMPEQACEAYAIAEQSPDREVAVRAGIGSVYCALESSDRRAEAKLNALIGRYPHLTQRESLSFALAMARERWGDARGASVLLRKIDLDRPATPTAARARVELARLQELGIRVEPYNWREQVLRAERLLQSGPVEDAVAAVEAMRDEARVNPSLRFQVEQLDQRIARIQGRFDAKPGSASAETALVSTAQTQDDPYDAERSAAERRIQAVRANRSTSKLSSGQVRQLLELALEYGDQALATEMVGEIATRRTYGPDLRFMLGLRAAGLADDNAIAALFETLLDVRPYKLPARYHRARALERAKRFGEAEAEFQSIVSEDVVDGYYRMWSNMRLAALREQLGARCLPPDEVDAQRTETSPQTANKPTAPEHLSATEAEALSTEEERARQELSETREDLAARYDPEQILESRADEPMSIGEGFAEEVAPDRPDDVASPATRTAAAAAAAAAVGSLYRPATPLPTPPPAIERPAPVIEIRDPAQRRTRALQLLAPLVAQYGEAYPWFGRAEELVGLELFDDAADEVNEAYLAFRDAKGSAPLRSGLVSLLTGAPPPRHVASGPQRRARLGLDDDARLKMSELATLLGDAGIGFRLGTDRLFLPRAYREIVESAAAKFGLDPNLLFAVMRVESVFNRRILSNAGAVGLMQIMPYTGQRIAYRLGIDDFEPTQLLTPKRNLEFSAWYLASLIRRFDGRLPLAIAAYNGGPHNVRLWLRNNRADMPLDAFLERIPFKETNHYVRRVLSFYALYRAQQDLPVAQLMVELPTVKPDPVAF